MCIQRKLNHPCSTPGELKVHQNKMVCPSWEVELCFFPVLSLHPHPMYQWSRHQTGTKPIALTIFKGFWDRVLAVSSPAEVTVSSLWGHGEIWQLLRLLVHFFPALVQTRALTLGSFPKIHGLREATTIIICQRSLELSYLQHSHLLSCRHLLPVIY